ncbi:Caleosin related protein-domain-containing protein [Boeremia exigua]|uniref:Caleosin related protein-domain-containing protein n=1 Tax=Boeremia exigua TaxID=749465 RepID=UPI001E8DAB51|nr:Caleosin related protein-domain-containing protein [Boeremia exigua]KAH6644392.1 Caleosin related protein-domain-containing protein [Boeremia exigua]
MIARGEDRDMPGTEKVWRAEGLAAPHDGLANGDAHLLAVNHVPVTRAELPWIPPKDSPLKDPGIARANIAATHAHPHGTTAHTWSKRYAHQTVLQQHCAFFDRDADGILWPSDTYTGFRALGFSVLVSAIALFIIHLNFAFPTSDSWVPDPCFRINLANVHRTKHGSDSDVFDQQGRFRPQAFEDVFAKYGDAGGGGEGKGEEGLSLRALARMIWAQRNVGDVIGWGGAVFEWGVTWLMIWPEDGVLRKEEVRRVFDGSLFHEWAREVERKKRTGGKGGMRRW